MEVEALLWPIYEALAFTLLRPPPRARCSCKCRCVFFAALFGVVTVLLFVTTVALHVAHVGGSGGCMPVALASLLEPNMTFTDEDVFRFRVSLSPPGPVFRSSDPSFEPDYIWSGKHEGVTLGQESRDAHGFRSFNFTLPLSCSASSGSFLDALYSSVVLPPDTPVVNAAMFGRPGAAGYLVNRRTGEDWSWGPQSALSSSVLVPGARGAGMSLLFRLVCVINLLLGYFLMSSVTAFMFRLFVLSMPAFMYPVLALIQRCIPTARADPQVLDVNFPWLGGYALAARLQDEVAGQPFEENGGDDAADGEGEGGGAPAAAEGAAPAAAAGVLPQIEVPLQQQQRQQQQQQPLRDGDEAARTGPLLPAAGAAGGEGLRQRGVRGWLARAFSNQRQQQLAPRRMPSGAVAAIGWAHVQQVFLVAMAYEGVSYVVGALLLTFKSYPNNLSVLLWLTMLLAEAFCAMCVRSLIAMTLFPRACFVLYAAFYYYYIAFAYPFSMLAAVTLFFAVLTLMMCSMLFCEVPACAAGRISSARPRAVVVLLPTAVIGQRDPPVHWAAPPLWSLFMPASYRPPAPVNAYDVPVPAVHEIPDEGAVVGSAAELPAGDARARLLGHEENAVVDTATIGQTP
jgi:hypothetical protein